MDGHSELRFAYSLALRLGMPVGTMLRQMSSREFTGWIAFFNVDQAKNDGRENSEAMLRSLNRL